MKRSHIFLFIFFASCLLQVTSLVISWPLGIDLSKPLLVLSLVGYYVLSIPQRSGLFITALLFCWLGDVLLIFQPDHELFFIGGLVAFLTGHVLYILTYRQHQLSNQADELLPTQKARYSFPIILAGTGLIVVLFPHLGVLKIPVLVYASVLMMMVMMALFRYGRTSSTSFRLVLTGAVFFMISDSVLAINKFYKPIEMGGLLIMTTYILAQYLIVEGIIKHKS